MATALGIYVTVDDLTARLGLGTPSTATSALLGQICDETNQWVESYTGRVLGPVDSATYTFDGGGPENPDRYTLDLFRLGIRSVSELKTATLTGGTLSVVDPSTYYIRPSTVTGEPATKLYLYTGSFYSGFGTIEITMTAGFEAVPDDVRAVAIVIATRAWHGRQTGMADVIGADTITDRAIVTPVVPPEMKATLDRYKPVLVR